MIVWQRSFDRFRPVIMGSRFVRVTGRLQSESNVIHIVAERMEDLSPWLADLSEQATRIDPYVRADAVRHGGSDPRERKPERNHGALAQTAKGEAANPSSKQEELTWQTQQVMPKGRNFH